MQTKFDMFRTFEAKDHPLLRDWIKQYYTEDHPGFLMEDEQIDLTLNEFTKHPEKGCVLILTEGEEAVGYCIIVYFWSNERGGNILNIDELFIAPAHRGKGLGSAFLKELLAHPLNGSVAFELVTTPQNSRARELYKKLGFQESSDVHLEMLKTQ